MRSAFNHISNILVGSASNISGASNDLTERFVDTWSASFYEEHACKQYLTSASQYSGSHVTRGRRGKNEMRGPELCIALSRS
jgi:hypothetical protein